jgi:hypothetical protein
MFVAYLHGKLSLREDASEDFLTSSVFSVLNYLDENTLAEFLQRAVNLKNHNLEVDLQDAVIEYWPWHPNSKNYGGGAEPDVVIYTQNTAIIVEAKNYSGKSGAGLQEEQDCDANDSKIIVDQLGREYFAARKNLLHKTVEKEGQWFRIDNILVVYLTRHLLFPKFEIEESINAIKYKNSHSGETSEPDIYWLNWHSVIPVLKRIVAASAQKSFANKIAKDLIAFLEKRDIRSDFDFSFLEKCSSLSSDCLALDNVGHLFYPEIIIKYWKDIQSQTITESAKNDLFYRSVVSPYWDFVSPLEDLDLGTNCFYKE